ncbi:hypothetical protein OPQ81_010526 [Rhizoctonia solani]|nr:hypothetical protein OPQ81_010526 [Rhizoctonia solani]
MGGNCEVSDVIGQENLWYTGRTGWIISDIFVASTFTVTCVNVTRHARNYRAPKEQRQIISILYMPLAYGAIVYEVITLSAFLYLMIQYVANVTSTASIGIVLKNKDKKRLPAPWRCFRYRPAKPSFMHMVKWLVFQFMIIGPVISTISIILYALGAMCPTNMSSTNPNIWLTVTDVFSMVTATYGLILFYKLTKQELKGHRPLPKFGIIKGVIFITIVQELVSRSLSTRGAIKPTEKWSSTEVADGLNTFLLAIEMAIASVIMLWAFSASEYFVAERKSQRSHHRQHELWYLFIYKLLSNRPILTKNSSTGDFVSEMKQ